MMQAYPRGYSTEAVIDEMRQQSDKRIRRRQFWRVVLWVMIVELIGLGVAWLIVPDPARWGARLFLYFLWFVTMVPITRWAAKELRE